MSDEKEKSWKARIASVYLGMVGNMAEDILKTPEYQVLEASVPGRIALGFQKNNLETGDLRQKNVGAEKYLILSSLPCNFSA